MFRSLLALVLGASVAFAAEFADISAADLQKAIADKTVTILDCNGSKSFAKGRVPGALDFEAVKGDLAKHLPTDKNALVVAYCGSPRCTAYEGGLNAAKELGYTNLKHLSIGIKGWKKDNLPVESN